MTSPLPSSFEDKHSSTNEPEVYTSNAKVPLPIAQSTAEAKKSADKAWTDYKNGQTELPDLKPNSHQIDPKAARSPKEPLSDRESAQINQAVADAKSKANEAFNRYLQTKE